MLEPICSSLKWFKYLLQVPKQKRSMKWADDLCSTGRSLHIDVWADRLKKNVVKDEVLKLMKDALIALSEVSPRVEDYDKGLIEDYMQNDEDRLKHIETRYLRGLPPSFDPGHHLRDRARTEVEV